MFLKDSFSILVAGDRFFIKCLKKIPIRVKATAKPHIPVALEIFCLISNRVTAIFHLPKEKLQYK